MTINIGKMLEAKAHVRLIENGVKERIENVFEQHGISTSIIGIAMSIDIDHVSFLISTPVPIKIPLVKDLDELFGEAGSIRPDPYDNTKMLIDYYIEG